MPRSQSFATNNLWLGRRPLCCIMGSPAGFGVSSSMYNRGTIHAGFSTIRGAPCLLGFLCRQVCCERMSEELLAVKIQPRRCLLVHCNPMNISVMYGTHFTTREGVPCQSNSFPSERHSCQTGEILLAQSCRSFHQATHSDCRLDFDRMRPSSIIPIFMTVFAIRVGD